jgi:hypothetical protein
MVLQALLDDIGSLRQHMQRDRDAQRLGGLAADHEVQPAWLLDWEISRLSASRQAVHTVGGSAVHCGCVAAVAHQAASDHEHLGIILGRHTVFSHEGDYSFLMCTENGEAMTYGAFACTLPAARSTARPRRA